MIWWTLRTNQPTTMGVVRWRSCEGEDGMDKVQDNGKDQAKAFQVDEKRVTLKFNITKKKHVKIQFLHSISTR